VWFLVQVRVFGAEWWLKEIAADARRSPNIRINYGENSGRDRPVDLS
jgi:hypothetical protein